MNINNIHSNLKTVTIQHLISGLEVYKVGILEM